MLFSALTAVGLKLMSACILVVALADGFLSFFFFPLSVRSENRGCCFVVQSGQLWLFCCCSGNLSWPSWSAGFVLFCFLQPKAATGRITIGAEQAQRLWGLLRKPVNPRQGLVLCLLLGSSLPLRFLRVTWNLPADLWCLLFSWRCHSRL